MKPLITFLILTTSLSVFTQNQVLTKKVDLEYKRVRLDEVLTDITNVYQVNFSYSKDLINVRQRVSISVKNTPLSEALIILFENTDIEFALVSNHIVLKANPGKRSGNRQNGKQTKSDSPQKEIPKFPEPEQSVSESKEMPVHQEKNFDPAIQLEVPKTRDVRSNESMYPFDEVLLSFEWLRQLTERPLGNAEDKRRIAQATIIPGFGTNRVNSFEITNMASLNILWGDNGGVEGAEIGGVFNSLEKHMSGFQFAGIGNLVKGNVTGTQLAGAFNSTAGYTRGFQFAGLGNQTGYLQGVQLSAVYNSTQKDASGVQIAGLYNHAGADANAIQVALGLNKSKGKARLQASGLMNFAGDVETAQVSTLLNVADEVKGFQLALVNKADTVRGVSVGLLNLIKKGYNKLELFAGEGLHGNAQLKLGAGSFYNIFQIGARYPDTDHNSTLWGFGYGLGTKMTLNFRNDLNLEILAIHINENESFTKKLNSIGQFRLLWNYQIGKRVGLFMGPTANVMVSSLKNQETSEAGSGIVPYSLLSFDMNKDTNLKSWIGFNAGFRFW